MDSWRLIVGLGNPGDTYANTRHNAGFLAVEGLARRWSAQWAEEKRFSARVARADLEGCRVLLCQPQTFMNLSGEAVGPLSDYYKIGLDRLLIVVDDADLALGEVRLLPEGGSGGHHGLESVEMHVASTNYPRQRIGIGRPTGGGNLSAHVLGSFTAEERMTLEGSVGRAAEQVECWLKRGIQAAMNDYNGKGR